MVMEIIVNVIDDYCLLLSLFYYFLRLAHFSRVYFCRQARPTYCLLYSTFLFSCLLFDAPQKG